MHYIWQSGTLSWTLLSSKSCSGLTGAVTSKWGVGTRLLKQDYCIPSDNHFNVEKLSQSASAVRASWNLPVHSLTCLVLSDFRFQISGIACQLPTHCREEQKRKCEKFNVIFFWHNINMNTHSELFTANQKTVNHYMTFQFHWIRALRCSQPKTFS